MKSSSSLILFSTLSIKKSVGFFKSKVSNRKFVLACPVTLSPSKLAIVSHINVVVIPWIVVAVTS